MRYLTEQTCVFAVMWTPPCRADVHALITDRVGCHTAVCVFIVILDIQRQNEVYSDVNVVGLVYFLLFFVPAQGNIRCVLHRTIYVTAPIIHWRC